MAITQQEVIASNMHVGNLKKLASTKTRSFWLEMSQGIVVINPWYRNTAILAPNPIFI